MQDSGKQDTNFEQLYCWSLLTKTNNKQKWLGLKPGIQTKEQNTLQNILYNKMENMTTHKARLTQNMHRWDNEEMGDQVGTQLKPIAHNREFVYLMGVLKLKLSPCGIKKVFYQVGRGRGLDFGYPSPVVSSSGPTVFQSPIIEPR